MWLLVAVMGMASGCILHPTGSYVAQQCSGNPRWVRESNERLYGNITRLTTQHIQDSLSGPDDAVLPPVLDHSLNILCIIPAYPVSIVFDVVSFPYQWWRFCHLPPLPEEEVLEQNGKVGGAAQPVKTDAP